MTSKALRLSWEEGGRGGEEGIKGEGGGEAHMEEVVCEKSPLLACQLPFFCLCVTAV